MVADPAAELIALVRAMGDPAPSTATAAQQAQAELVRRRFAVSLPPPFAGEPGRDEPVRLATPLDGAAIASVKWRAFGTNYRGLLPDSFIDNRDVVPGPGFWTGRAMIPPTRRHRLLVWGRPGSVFGYVDCGPSAELDHGAVGEVWELYVDPAAQGRGGGSALLAAAEVWLDSVGLDRQELNVLAQNLPSQAFYEARGWLSTGTVVHVDLGVVAFDELRLRRGGS